MALPITPKAKVFITVHIYAMFEDHAKVSDLNIAMLFKFCTKYKSETKLFQIQLQDVNNNTKFSQTLSKEHPQKNIKKQDIFF